jgi:hypothetical protein
MKTLMDIMKSSMTSLYESLLDDEEELLDKSNLNIFDIISKSQSKDEFYEHIKTLCNSCIAVNINDDLSKYKNSFFLMELMATYNNSNYGIKIDRYFKKTKNSVFVNYFRPGKISAAMADKLTFHELRYEYVPALKSDTVYVFPKNIEKQYIEWVQNHPILNTYKYRLL